MKYPKKYPKICSAKTVDDHILIVEFDNSERKKHDITHLLNKDRFAPLKNPIMFKNIIVEKGGHAIYWNEDIDISEYELWKNGISLPQ